MALAHRKYTFPYKPPIQYRGRDTKAGVPLVPYLEIQFRVGEELSIPHEAIVDSGADCILIPKSLGETFPFPRVPEQDERPPSEGAGGRFRTFRTTFELIVNPRVNGGDNVGLVHGQVISEYLDIDESIAGESPILLGRIPFFELYQEIRFEENRKRFVLVPQNEPRADTRKKGPKRRKR